MTFGTKLIVGLSTLAAILSIINNQKYTKSHQITNSTNSNFEIVTPVLASNKSYLKSYDWGPGGPVDEFNRSTGALQYNKKFGKYDSYFIGQNEKKMFLTFDEGYEHGLTDDFLDVLKEKNVKATFFITYDFAKTQKDLVDRMIKEGHTVGNHSKTHKHFSTLSKQEIIDDVQFMQDFIQKNHNYTMKFFRAPSGNFNEQALDVIKGMGLKNVFWSFAYKDWLVNKQPDPAKSLEKLKKSAIFPGNILLLHAVSETNLKILPEYLDYVKSQGYEWETLDNLKLGS